MSPTRPGALACAALLAGSTLAAQRVDLPFGLRAGRRDVGVRVLSGADRAVAVWHPAACGRPRAASAPPCADAPPDSGRFPLLLLGTEGRAPEDTARAAYFASHAYTVVFVDGAGAEAALRAVRGLAFVDTLDPGPAGWGGEASRWPR